MFLPYLSGSSKTVSHMRSSYTRQHTPKLMTGKLLLLLFTNVRYNMLDIIESAVGEKGMDTTVLFPFVRRTPLLRMAT